MSNTILLKFISVLRNNIYLTIFFLLVFTVSIFTAHYVSIPKYPEAASCQDFGLYIGQDLDEQTLSKLPEIYGAKPALLLTFIAWSDMPFSHNLKELKRMVSHGYSPVITLEPWYYPSKKQILLSNIIDGKEDHVIAKFAESIKELQAFSRSTSNVDIYIRFAHEMNGNWYPWSGFKNEKDTELYKKAYIRVHDLILQKSGLAINQKSSSKKHSTLKFIWSVNADDIPSSSWNKGINYYPGSEYVDVIGLDGYNWGTSRFWPLSWRSFKHIFKKPIRELIKLNKPIYITETASAGSKSWLSKKDKARWINGLFETLEGDYAFIPTFIWFDIDKEKDWRIMSDEPSDKSFRSGLGKLKRCSKKALDENK